MIYDYLQRGVLAGVVAGLAYGVYMAVVANPLSEYIHDSQQQHGHGHDHSHVHESSQTVSEATTAIVSAGSGVLWAIFLGGLFALALYLFEPALPGSDAVKSYILAGAGYLTVSVTPWLALPPAAPGAEQLYGIETRLAIYVGLVALGALVSAAAISGYTQIAPRHRALGVLAGAIPIVSIVIVVPLVSPSIVTHPDLPVALYSTYQALAALSQAAIWLLLAATFNGLRRRARPAAETDDSSEPLLASP